MISSCSSNINRPPNSTSTVAESSSASPFGSTAPSTGPTSASRMDAVRSRLLSQGICEGTAKVICESWTRGTRKQYEPAWSKWVSRCGEGSHDPFQAPVKVFLNFLNHLYEEEKAYSTINTYRSAVSSTVEAVTGRNVGCHHLVPRFMKGVYVGRSPQPKYITAWDVSQVTEYLKTMPPVSELSIKELTSNYFVSVSYSSKMSIAEFLELE